MWTSRQRSINRPQVDITHPHGLFFIVGVGRSGTTLLQRMLDAHPQMAVAPETHFMPRIWSQQERFGDLANDTNWDVLVDEILELPPYVNCGSATDRLRILAASCHRDYGTLFRAVIRSTIEQQDMDLLGEKTPMHLRYVRAISRLFPEARFIHIVRDPRAVINSLKKVPWSTGEVSLEAHFWKSAIRSIDRLPRGIRQSIHTLRYEDLVRHPQRTLTNVCDFLDLQFSPAMLQYHLSPFQDYDLVMYPWLKNAESPPMHSRIDQWRVDLPPSQIFEIEAILWRYMRRHGYRRISSTAQFLGYAGSDALKYNVRRVRYRIKKRTEKRRALVDAR